MWTPGQVASLDKLVYRFCGRGANRDRHEIDMELLLSERIFKMVFSAKSGIAASALVAAVALAGCGTDALSTSETLTQGYVIDQQQIDQVPVGSSREQVLLALGTPSTTATFDNEVFYYISQTRVRSVAFQNPKLVDQRVLAVYFGDDSRVTRIANYGKQDGKPFDFISRTTPTGGKDHNFLEPDCCPAPARSPAIFLAAAAAPPGRPPEQGAPLAARQILQRKSPPDRSGGLFVSWTWPDQAVREHGEQQQRHDVGDLDRRVDGRAGSVLVGIADRVAGDRGLVRLRALHVLDAVLVDEAVLERLLGVVPGAAARGHRDGDEQAVDDDAEQRCAERGEGRGLGAGDQQHAEIDDQRRQHRQQRRDDHLLDRRPGEQVDGARIVRLRRAGHDARILAELPAHLLDDRAGRTADRRHGDAAEQIRDQAAEDQAGDHVGVGQVERDGAQVREIRELRRVGGKVLQVVAVGREQHQRAEAGRADRVALGDRLGGVADRVERVGRMADFLGQAGHFGDAAGIVGDRAKGVERHDHAGEAEHGGDRDRRAEQAGKLVGRDDAADDDERRQRRRFQRDREALDDVGAVAGDRGLGDRVHRALVGAGVVLGDHHDQRRHHEADQAADEQVLAGDGHAGDGADLAPADGHRGGAAKADDRQQAGDDQALVERAHDRAVRAELDEERADDRGDDAGAADRQRIEHARWTSTAVPPKKIAPSTMVATTVTA